jgi:hypothetical protein
VAPFLHLHICGPFSASIDMPQVAPFLHLHICVRLLLCVSSCYYMCPHTILYMCPHASVYVSSYNCMCPHTTFYVLYYYMCPHTNHYICVLMLLCMCALAGGPLSAPAGF